VSGIDELISKSFSAVIKKNLDPNTEKKVKMRLFTKYGLSINQAIKDFSKIDNILKEFLSSDTSSFETKCLLKIISLQNSQNSSIVTIKDKYLINTFLKILGDDEYRKIIEFTNLKPLLIKEIIDVCQLPKTSGYRKINYLIRNGLLIKVETEFTDKRRSVEKLAPIFQKIIFEMKKNKKIIKLVIHSKIIKQSSTIQIII
jgi:DNA-binding MarR family transcriptional regulator